MQQALIVLWLLGFILLPARPAAADLLCSLFKHCFYEGVAFRITVVDKETGQPLADVHALAEWGQYGAFGRNGPLMVQDAVSGPDGVLAFPAWGPIRGSSEGLIVNEAPVITLFKPGYVLIVPEGARRAIFPSIPRGTAGTTRVWRFAPDGKTFEMERFRGTPEEWIIEMKRIFSGAVPHGEPGLRRFRGPYLNRLKRVQADTEKLPRTTRGIADLQGQLAASIDYIEEHPQ